MKFQVTWQVVALVSFLATLVTGVLLVLVLKDKAPASVLIVPLGGLVGAAVAGPIAYLKGLFEPTPTTLDPAIFANLTRRGQNDQK